MASFCSRWIGGGLDRRFHAVPTLRQSDLNARAVDIAAHGLARGRPQARHATSQATFFGAAWKRRRLDRPAGLGVSEAVECFALFGETGSGLLHRPAAVAARVHEECLQPASFRVRFGVFEHFFQPFRCLGAVFSARGIPNPGTVLPSFTSAVQYPTSETMMLFCPDVISSCTNGTDSMPSLLLNSEPDGFP